MNRSIFFTPALSSLIKSKQVCWAVSGVAALHLTLVTAGLPSWQCPIRSNLGIPCPGCGLSRAMLALVQGQWQHALVVHAFAPVAIGVLLFIAVASFLPTAFRRVLAQRIESIEVHLGLTGIALSIFLLYWLVRLLFFSESFYDLVL